MRGCRMVVGVPPELGSGDRNGATVVLRAVPSVRTGFAFSALNRSTWPCTVTPWLNRNVRLSRKASWFQRGSYLVPGDATLTTMAGSPAKREGGTIAPGV